MSLYQIYLICRTNKNEQNSLIIVQNQTKNTSRKSVYIEQQTVVAENLYKKVQKKLAASKN